MVYYYNVKIYPEGTRFTSRDSFRWAAVRTLAHPITGRPSSGLVPKSYLRSKTPRYRGYALYKYNPDNFRFIQMYLGQELGVYKVYGPWALVKLDGSGGQIGFVPEGYIKSVEGTGKVCFME